MSDTTESTGIDFENEDKQPGTVDMVIGLLGGIVFVYLLAVLPAVVIAVWRWAL